jgi:SAM-dependent methyltransferase
MNVVWHDAECGAYEADLPLWEELADDSDGPILDLGCGTGRVAVALARRGYKVRGLDREPAFVAALNDRAQGLVATGSVGDAREFALEDTFSLALAPMQLVQLFADKEERSACLRCLAAHLMPGGLAAFAIVEEMSITANPSPPLPDTREVDGWVYSSLPLETGIDNGTIVVRRLRQTVSPAGELSDEVDEVRLRVLSASTLEREAAAAGLRPAGRRLIPATEEHVGSTVVLVERAA